jgi:ubiquitin C-terminal hydrolase
MHVHSKMITGFVEYVRLDLENHWKCPPIQKQHQAKQNKENMNQP